jgi:ornithine decarboxylase
MTQQVNRALDKFFPDSSGVEVIAEPGRYLVESAFTLATNIHSKKATQKYGDKYFMYHINDGVYGAFSMTLTKRMTVQPKVFGKTDEPMYKCTVWGPTCDGLDKV